MILKPLFDVDFPLGTIWGHDCISVVFASLVLPGSKGRIKLNMASLEQRNVWYRIVFRVDRDKYPIGRLSVSLTLGMSFLPGS